ncbi:hypothetical protein HDU96_006070 [Phlyctochytrium bullatum]|nr:hypothetical protein HDU96_006070 [Phlyctochytrium bullatum]
MASVSMLFQAPQHPMALAAMGPSCATNSAFPQENPHAATTPTPAEPPVPGRRGIQPPPPLAVPRKWTSSGSVPIPAARIQQLPSPTAWEHAFQPSAATLTPRRSLDDMDTLQTPTQESVSASFSDRLGPARLHPWTAHTDDKDDDVAQTSPASSAISSTAPSSCSGSTVSSISSLTSESSSSSAQAAAPRLDMSLFTPPQPSLSIPSSPHYGSLSRRVSAASIAHHGHWSPGHARTASAPHHNSPPPVLAASPPTPHSVAASPVLSPAVIPLLANWKPLALSSSRATSAAGPAAHSPLLLPSPPAVPAPTPADPHCFRRASLPVVLVTTPVAPGAPRNPAPAEPTAYHGSLDRCTTVSRRGRFTVTREPSQHYHAHVRRASAVEAEEVVEGVKAMAVSAAPAGPTRVVECETEAEKVVGRFRVRETRWVEKVVG